MKTLKKIGRNLTCSQSLINFCLFGIMRFLLMIEIGLMFVSDEREPWNHVNHLNLFSRRHLEAHVSLNFNFSTENFFLSKLMKHQEKNCK